ncbi:MAG TPA: A24 family peptidase [Steroidobacteraceae bacterium]
MRLIDVFAASPVLFTVACAVVGLLVGSFLNVVIHRVPVMLQRQWRAECAQLSGAAAPAQADRFNLVVPRSACPACHAPIHAWQNIPIVSFLALRGRCAACGVAISVRYPVVEALTGLMSAAVAWKFGFGVAACGGIVLTWFLIALAFIDIDHQLLPDHLTLPLLWLGLAFALWGGGVPAASLPVDLKSSVLGAVAGYLSLWSVYQLFRLATGKEGMGYGDFKLLAALGAWLGWQMLLPIVLAAAAVGAVSGILLLFIQGRDRATPVAFGPYLAGAGWLMLILGHELVQRYLGLFAGRS